MNSTTSLQDVRRCNVCRVDISDRRRDATICGGKACRNVMGAAAYHLRRTAKPCAICGKVALRKRQERTCVGCRGEAHRRGFSEVRQTVTCRKCGASLYVVTKKLTKTNQSHAVGFCEQCRQNLHKRRSEVKRGSLNPNWKGGVRKTRKTPEQLRLERSERMKRNNPMKSPETAKKVGNTIRSLIAAGELTHRKGPGHHLWKGNREPSFVIRARLSPWVRAVMARDSFRCVDCPKRRNLEVHHTKAFDAIVEECRTELGLGRLVDMDVNSVEFGRLSDLVVAKHDLSIGITYCKPCHAKHDSRRRI